MKITMTPIVYQINDLDQSHTRVESRGDNSWAVKHISNEVLTKDLNWIYEPMPSSRTKEFIEKTRFSSAEEALETYKKWLNALSCNQDCGSCSCKNDPDEV